MSSSNGKVVMKFEQYCFQPNAKVIIKLLINDPFVQNLQQLLQRGNKIYKSLWVFVGKQVYQNSVRLELIRQLKKISWCNFLANFLKFCAFKVELSLFLIYLYIFFYTFY